MPRMNRRFTGFAAAVALAAALSALTAASPERGAQQRPGRVEGTGRDYPVQPVPFTSVHLDDVFWAPRIETNRKVTIPVAFQQCERTQRVYNFERAAAVLRGDKIEDLKPPPYPFVACVLYKVIVGAADLPLVAPCYHIDAH